MRSRAPEERKRCGGILFSRSLQACPATRIAHERALSSCAWPVVCWPCSLAACRYNARTQDKVGTVIPVEISVFEDRSFTFILKTPPAAELLKKAAKVSKGSGEPAVRTKSGDLTYNFVGDITMAQVEEIAKIKLPDLNTNKLQSAMNTVMGTAKNMGSKLRAPSPPLTSSLPRAKRSASGEHCSPRGMRIQHRVSTSRADSSLPPPPFLAVAVKD